MKTYAIRLSPGDDLKTELIKYTNKNNIKAGCILTCVGSLNGANIRLSDGKTTKEYKGKYEIVSLVGTLSPSDIHIHISFSDDKGNVYGGHLKENCKIHTTAEIVIGKLEGIIFTREHDITTGYKELKIKPDNL
jgi:uncharacterized protein